MGRKERRMNIERMLYVYLFICLGMIFFDVAMAVSFRRREKRTVKVSSEFRDKVSRELENIEKGGKVDEAHKQFMEKKLKKINNMIAFDGMLEEIFDEKEELVKEYLSQLESVFADLTSYYCKRNQLESAYYPYIIKKYRLIEGNPNSSIVEAMYRMLNIDYLYGRENAMQAIYTTGDSHCVVKAVKILDRSNIFFNSKLLTDGLLNFTGDRAELDRQFTHDFENFSPEMQVTLLNYLRFSSGDHQEFACSLLSDEHRDNELRYSAIRYLAKYPYEKAGELISKMAVSGSDASWQYAAIASTALASYPSAENIEILKNNLYSSNWYVRFNSAGSLEKLGITYLELVEVIDGEDRYASEILRYRMKADKMKTDNMRKKETQGA